MSTLLPLASVLPSALLRAGLSNHEWKARVYQDLVPDEYYPPCEVFGSQGLGMC